MKKEGWKAWMKKDGTSMSQLALSQCQSISFHYLHFCQELVLLYHFLNIKPLNLNYTNLFD